MTESPSNTDDDVHADEQAVHECDHDAAQVEHQGQSGTQVEFWLSCPDCDGYWTLTADLDAETANINQDNPQI